MTRIVPESKRRKHRARAGIQHRVGRPLNIGSRSHHRGMAGGRFGCRYIVVYFYSAMTT